MKKSFKHLLNQPLVWIYLAATSIGNTSFLYSVFGIFMISGFAVLVAAIVGIVIGIGLMALHHAIYKDFVPSKIGVLFSWSGIVLIMGLSIVGWFLIFHHVTFGLADMQYRKEILIQNEFKRIESGNERYMDSLRVTYQNNYSQAVIQRSPKTAREANKAILNLAKSKMQIDKETVNNKLNLLFEGNSFDNILLSYIARFRNTLGDNAAEILLWIMVILLSGGIDVSGFAFNRVTKNIDNEEKEENNIGDEIDLFDDETETEEFEDEYYILNNKDENVTEDVTPKIENDVTAKNGKVSQQKKTNIDKKIQKLIDNGNTNKTHIANQIKINGKAISRRTVQRYFQNNVNGELDE